MNLIALWKKMSALPGGKMLFSILLGKKIPYSGSIRACIDHLEPGKAAVVLKDRRSVRNHLHSIHAVALMNLGELCSGLATIGGLPKDMRGILVGFRIEYLKKARGTITARCTCDVPSSQERKEHCVPVELKNADGEVVCRAFATWLIGPAERPAP